MLKWLKMGVGHLVALPILVVGGYAGVFSITILLDVFVWTAGQQTEGLFIGTVILLTAAAGLGVGGGLLYYLWTTVWLAPETPTTELSGSTTLHQIREGFAVDYNLRTWTVTDHATYPYEGWPTDVWTLAANGEKRVLEYDGAKDGTFRLYESVPVSDVTVDGTSVPDVLKENEANAFEAPRTIEYAAQGRAPYVLAEENARVHDRVRFREKNPKRLKRLVRTRTDGQAMGLCGGLAAYLGVSSILVRVLAVALLIGWPIVLGTVFGITVMGVVFVGLIVSYVAGALVLPTPPSESLSHYWVYESDDGDLIALRCENGTWTARYGREVAPYEFDNLLPPGEERHRTASR